MSPGGGAEGRSPASPRGGSPLSCEVPAPTRSPPPSLSPREQTQPSAALLASPPPSLSPREQAEQWAMQQTTAELHQLQARFEAAEAALAAERERNAAAARDAEESLAAAQEAAEIRQRIADTEVAIERERAARQGSAKDRKKRPHTANQWK